MKKHSGYSHKICRLVLFILLVNLFDSCKKEDNKPPVITSINLIMNDTIRNNFNIKVEVTDNNSTARLELYANDSLFAQIDNLPFEYLWNTTKMKDGEYIIKAVVYDSKGNKAESSTTVLVQNALLTINLGSENHAPFKLVIFDEQGSILNSALIQGSGKVIIMPLTPAENDAINLVSYSTSNGFTGIIAYVHVKRGSEYNMDWKSSGPVVKGFKIHIKNDIGSFSQVWLSTDQTFYKISSMADTMNLPAAIPYTSGHKLLLQLETIEGKFYSFLTIDNIDELTVKLSDINIKQSRKSISIPSTGHASYLLMGSINEKDSTKRYYISEGESAPDADHLDVYYPIDYFSKYHTGVYFSQNNYDFKYYLNQYRGELPDRFDPISVDFEIVNPQPGNFKANTTGVFDLYRVEYYNQSQTIELQVVAPASQKEWKLPDLATAFDNIEFSLNNFIWNQVSIVNQGSLDWSNTYYDLSVNFEKLNFVEKYVQYLWIYNPLNVSKKQIRLKGENLPGNFLNQEWCSSSN